MILYGHAVGGGQGAIPVAAFRRQMEWLARHAEVLDLESLLEGRGTHPSLQASITFDDGYLSVATGAEPVMTSLGLTGTVYVNTGWISDGERRQSDPSLGHYPGQEFMNWADLERLASRGWTIGAHGVDHLDLTATDEAVVGREVDDSRAELARRLPGHGYHFAYTWGRHHAEVRRAVREAGYRSACGAIHAPLSRADDRFALPRIEISGRYDVPEFEAVAKGDWDYLGWVQRVRRRLAGLD